MFLFCLLFNDVHMIIYLHSGSMLIKRSINEDKCHLSAYMK